MTGEIRSYCLDWPVSSSWPLIAIVPKSFTEHRDRSADEFAVDDFPKERVWNRNLFFVAIAASCFGLSQYAFLSMYPTFLSGSLHYAPSSIGYTMSLFGLGGILALPIGFLGDRLKQKWIVLAALVGCAVVGYLIFNVAAAPGHHAILSCMLGFSGASFIANASSLMQRCVPNIHIGKASGIFVTSTYIPASFSGYLFGVLVGSLDWGGAALVQLTIIPLIGAASLLLINDRHGATRADAIVGEDSVKPAKGKRPLKAIAVSSVP
ncbi:MFS transporter [Bradyrhizobium sp. RDM4]|uniref:MFS transporter n=1 Tax=Bradyrhizobium sp. RDM4 TaxID=3378765 RepID=UPI0038FC34C2